MKSSSSLIRNFEVLGACRKACHESEEVFRLYIEVKAFQTRRFESDYSDLLPEGEFASALQFFLGELYGPRDFSERDRQFERIAPAVSEFFPLEVTQTVEDLVELHALSESLDLAMATELSHFARGVDMERYRVTWQKLDRGAERQRQLDLVLSLGTQLHTLTKKRVLRRMLGMMRVPARMAGLEDLQSFLERGFDSFSGMRSPAALMSIIRTRESTFLQAMNDAV